MSMLKKLAVALSVFGILFIQITPLHAGVVTTSEMLSQSQQIEQVSMRTREDVKQELIKLGIGEASSIERVNQMTDAELIEVSENLSELPVGEGVSTVDLLLIIILLILLL